MSERICSVADCRGTRVARGLCKRHYNKAHAAGALPPRTRTPDQFRHSISNVAEDGRTADCSVCGPGIRVRHRRRRSYDEYTCRTAAKEAPQTRRLRWIKGKYGISAREYADAFSGQGGLCLICGGKDPLVVDHCHKSGRMRGLLCTPCNLAIGFLRDNPERARAAAAYLESARWDS